MKRNDIIMCTEHPEWGTWRVIEEPSQTGIEDCYTIRGDSGPRVLFESEFNRFWQHTTHED